MSDGLPGLASSTSRHTRQWMSDWWLLGLLILTVVLLSLLGEQGRLWLRYDRVAVLQQGEYWRLLTGHLVHLGWLHLFWNLVALAVNVGLFERQYSPRQWLLIALSCLLVIDVGFVFWEPQLEWYVGLSGVLHGTLLAGCIRLWRSRFRRLALGSGGLVIAKLALEQWHGASTLSGVLHVVVDAHLYGAIGGVIAGTILWLSTPSQVAEDTQS